jgi:hypothetical protein
MIALAALAALVVVEAPLAQEIDKARQTMVVRFADPVMVGDRVLMGTYIIEHDNNRMAAGRPCTYIYNIGDRRYPVVAFRCTHLHRDRAKTPRVEIVSTGDPAIRDRMIAFQFAGEAAGHGVPRVR